MSYDAYASLVAEAQCAQTRGQSPSLPDVQAPTPDSNACAIVPAVRTPDYPPVPAFHLPANVPVGQAAGTAISSGLALMDGASRSWEKSREQWNALDTRVAQQFAGDPVRYLQFRNECLAMDAKYDLMRMGGIAVAGVGVYGIVRLLRAVFGDF